MIPNLSLRLTLSKLSQTLFCLLCMGCRTLSLSKLKHWRGLPNENTPKSAPMLEEMTI